MAASLLLLAAACSQTGGDGTARPAPDGSTTGAAGSAPSTTAASPVAGQKTPGLLTFRGNRTRTFYGQGPVPANPRVLRSFPDEAMCSQSSDTGGVFQWCGMGWTGQPAVAELNGRTWVVFGAYDGAVHFLDADTGQRILPDFPTGDLIKGSVTFDPDGYPLVYTGSRDNYFRVLAIDQPEATELWALSANAVSPVLWNNDWDGSALVIDDYLLEGGENSQFHIVKLNRDYGPDGKVTVDPELVFNAPGWDDELLDALGDDHVSIEGSVAVWDDTVYFSNSGGLVQGWDIGGLAAGREPTRTFRYWTGDDTDASVVIDDQGMLYVASEWERFNARAREVGQVVKLDPRRPNPLVWSVKDQGGGVAGVWATPAIYKDILIVPTNSGEVLGLDRETGVVRWSKQLPGPTWQSPVVVDDVLLQGDCNGVLHAYNVSNTRIDPPELWSLNVGGCIEATPAVWKGRIYLGTRNGYFTTIG